MKTKLEFVLRTVSGKKNSLQNNKAYKMISSNADGGKDKEVVEEKETNSLLVLYSFLKQMPQNKKNQKDEAKIVQMRPTLFGKEFASKVELAIKDQSLSGQSKEVSLFREFHFQNYRHVFVQGLGENWNAEDIRQLAAPVLEGIKKLKVSNVFIDFDSVVSSSKDFNSFLRAFVEGFCLSNYEFNDLKSSSVLKSESSQKVEGSEDLNRPRKSSYAAGKAPAVGKAPAAGKVVSSSTIKITLLTQQKISATLNHLLEEAQIVAEAVNQSRWWGDMPSNLMNPTLFAESVLEQIKGTSIKATVWDKARIKKERMEGLLSVAQGSSQEPRFIILEYKKTGSPKDPIVLVGKGVTFDSGGISIKPSAGMEDMKFDMCGAANAVGALLAISRMNLKAHVVAIVAATENMPGGSATRPGDIYRARNGKTFEVNNTDAEGRLILADALSYASELKPAVILDIATLTGAMVVALGNVFTGYFTRNEELKQSVESAAKLSGELVWRMPLTDFYVKDMKGTYADLTNTSSGKGAGSSTAAAFLEQFVEKEIPWVHFDIAGTAYMVGHRLNYASKKGASGAIVRTFYEFVKTS